MSFLKRLLHFKDKKISSGIIFYFIMLLKKKKHLEFKIQ